MKQNLIKSFSVIVIVFLKNLITIFTNFKTDFDVTTIFIQEIFGGSYHREDTKYYLLMSSVFSVIIFQFLFGRYIYDDYQISSVYIFTRRPNRTYWFLNKCLLLFVFTVIYTVTYTSSVLILAIRQSTVAVNSYDIKLYVIVTLSFILFTYVSTLLINVLAIRFGSSFGFVIVFIGFILLTQLAIHHNSIIILRNFPFLLKLNPVSYLVIVWDLTNYINLLIYYIILIILIITISDYYIKHMDIGLIDRESDY